MSFGFSSSTLSLPYIETPLIPSLYLSEITGAQVLLKLELVQPSGSFKSRGLGHLVHQTVLNSPPGTRLHFFSPSGGNAGCATAYAARQYGQKCTVCLPTSANHIMIERIKKTGATVVVHGNFIADSDKHIREVLMPACEDTAVYCHPYNNSLVWEGNSTIASEIVSQFVSPSDNYDSSSEESDICMDDEGIPSSAVTPRCKPDAVICSIGGGGLFNGLVQGFDKHSWNVPVVAVETEGCAALSKSIASGGDQVEISKPSTIATSLSTPNVTRETIDYAMDKNRETHSIVVSDADAALACIKFAQDHKLLIEAACGTALAPLYNGEIKKLLPHLDASSIIVVVVCGGTAISWEILEGYSKKFGIPL